jgi:protein associated with RNAse G/E
MPEEQIVTINSRKYDGTIRRSWQCRLVESNGTELFFIGDFDEEVRHADLGVIGRGTISYEYYWTNRWYNVFRFHEPDGDLRNFYCNINMPPTFANGALDYVDLDIDVLVWPDLSYTVLDEAEFEENARKFGYPHWVREKARKSLVELISLIEGGMLPLP